MEFPRQEEYTEDQIKEYLDSFRPGEGHLLVAKALDLLKNNKNLCTPLHRPVQTFLINALEQIITGTDANKALLLKRGKGAPKVNSLRDLILALAVKERKAKGMSYIDAIADVAYQWREDPNFTEGEATVKKAYDTFQRSISDK